MASDQGLQPTLAANEIDWDQAAKRVAFTGQVDSATLKMQGNHLCKIGKFLRAIDYYDAALTRATSQEDAVILLLNRCYARISLQAFDAALADAKAVLDLSPGNEKALFRAARAVYGLRRWKESEQYLVALKQLYPNNTAADSDLKRCRERFEEENGRYDFAGMMEEALAKLPSPDMDRATYVGPIDIRQCAIESHGRGLFTTKDVNAGELLLCEKAFSAAFSAGNYSSNTAIRSNATISEADKPPLELRAELATKTFVKLHRNPSITPGFADLYPGPDAEETIDEKTGLPDVDDGFVQLRIVYNAFGFPLLSRDFHWQTAHSPTGRSGHSASSGIWLRASYVNHSCYPSVRRSFIGDMMIWRAQRNIPKDTELRFGYISCLEDYKTRQEMLSKYGFECGCQICTTEKETSGKKFKKRDAIMLEIVQHFEKTTPTDLQTYFDFLDALDATYSTPAILEPRRALITPLINLITNCSADGLHVHVIDLVHRLLAALGFEIKLTHATFKVLQWGYLIDEIVVSLADLCEAYKAVDPTLLPDAREVAMTAYEIMCGERESWESAYGRGRMRVGTERRTEDVDVDGGGG